MIGYASFEGHQMIEYNYSMKYNFLSDRAMDRNTCSLYFLALECVRKVFSMEN